MGSTNTSLSNHILSLNKSIIDSYLIGPIKIRGYKEHKECAICLEEYSVPDVLVRRLPEFIDEWLYMNAVGPVCTTLHQPIFKAAFGPNLL